MLLSLILNSSVPFKVQGHNRIACGFLGFSLFLSSVPAVSLTRRPHIPSMLSHHLDGFFRHLGQRRIEQHFWIASNGRCLYWQLQWTRGGICTWSHPFSPLPILPGIPLSTPLFFHTNEFQAYTSGGGAAAIFVTLLRMLCKAALTNSPDGLRISASVFFLTSAFICFACFLVQRCVIMPHPIFQDSALLTSSSESDHSDSPSIDDDASSPFSFLHFHVLRNLRLSLLSLIFLYITTTIMFPGVPADAEVTLSSHDVTSLTDRMMQNATLEDWYKILLVLIYSIGDFVSRLVPRNAICTTELPIAIAVVLRGLLVPIVFFVVRYLSHPFTLSSLMLFLGLTNG